VIIIKAGLHYVFKTVKIRIVLFLLLFSIPSFAFANESPQPEMDAVTQRYYHVIFNTALHYSGLGPEWSNWISLTILSNSYKYSINPLFATTMLLIESNLNHWSDSAGGIQVKVSSAGAIGFSQLMPGTAAALGVDPYDPEQNIEGGVKYLRQQLDSFQYAGVWGTDYAVAAYNAGPGEIKKYGGIPPYSETINYLNKFGSVFNQLDSEFQQM
jgi:soluble lytic murein transglycosylase-like protein